MSVAVGDGEDTYRLAAGTDTDEDNIHSILNFQRCSTRDEYVVVADEYFLWRDGA